MQVNISRYCETKTRLCLDTAGVTGSNFIVPSIENQIFLNFNLIFIKSRLFNKLNETINLF